MVPIIFLLPGKFNPVCIQKVLEGSFDKEPTSPSSVLFTALRACIHDPSVIKLGSESLFIPLIKVLVEFTLKSADVFFFAILSYPWITFKHIIVA